MRAWTKSELSLSINVKQEEVIEVGDGVEGARGGRPFAKALGGRAHSNQ